MSKLSSVEKFNRKEIRCTKDGKTVKQEVSNNTENNFYQCLLKVFFSFAKILLKEQATERKGNIQKKTFFFFKVILSKY